MPRELLSRDIQEAAQQLMPYFLSKLGQNVLGGSLLPSGMGGEDLGSTSRYFNAVYALTIKAHLVEAMRLLGGVNPNLLRNGSFEQVEQGFTNQPRFWVLSQEVSLAEAVGT